MSRVEFHLQEHYPWDNNWVTIQISDVWPTDEEMQEWYSEYPNVGFRVIKVSNNNVESSVLYELD